MRARWTLPAPTAVRMAQERFTDVFSRDEAGLPRAWGPAANVPAAAREARLAAARVLARLAVLRLDQPPAVRSGLLLSPDLLVT
jgi:hypothetical protein